MSHHHYERALGWISAHRATAGGSVVEPDLYSSQLELLDLEAAGWLDEELSCETGWSCCQGHAAAWAQRWLNCPDCGKQRGIRLACQLCQDWVTSGDVYVECSECDSVCLAEDLLIHWERL